VHMWKTLAWQLFQPGKWAVMYLWIFLFFILIYIFQDISILILSCEWTQEGSLPKYVFSHHLRFKITTSTGDNFKMGQYWNIFINILLPENTKRNFKSTSK
jgi:hypothetical protein